MKVEIDDGMPAVVHTDSTRLHQVLNNLIGNAVKFTPKGTIAVNATMSRNENPALCRISVTDTGIGIPRDKLEDVFTAFTQADSSTTRKYGGTGLGLAICKRIVEMLGGEISVQSREGEGSTFSFSFCDMGPGEEDVDDDDAEIERASSPLKLADTLKILIAEDDPFNYKLTRKLLERHGFDPDWAQNGLEAVEMAEREDYALIFMDLQMPELDGMAAARRIRASCVRQRQPYIAALTANALGGSREACGDAGMEDFITKPVSGEDMKQALRRFQQNYGAVS